MQVSTFGHFHDQKREYDVIFMHSTRLHVNTNYGIRNVISSSCEMHHANIVLKRPIHGFGKIQYHL